MSEQQQEPTVITLNETNSIQIMAQYIEVAQQKGAYLLNEAELLKRAIDILVNQVPDKEITDNVAKSLLIQGVNKGQKSGSYTLNDASLLSKVVAFVASGVQGQAPAVATPAVESNATQDHVPVSELLDDLSELAEPIPLKPKEV